MQRVAAADLLAYFERNVAPKEQERGKAKRWNVLARILVRRLSELDGAELIAFDPGDGPRPVHRYIRVLTGEVLAEMRT